MAIIFLQRIANALGALLQPRRAVAFGAGFTLTDKPDETLTGSPDAPGQVTGYTLVELSGSGSGAVVPQARTITCTAPLKIDGGASGDLSANRTLSIDSTGTLTAAVLSLKGLVIEGVEVISTSTNETKTILTIGVPQHASIVGDFYVHARHRASTAGLLGGAAWPGTIAVARGTGSAEDNSGVGAAYIDPTGSEVDGANATASISGSTNWILEVNGIAATNIDWLVSYRISIKATA